MYSLSTPAPYTTFPYNSRSLFSLQVMPIFSSASDIQFYYADSGVPSISDYTTYFIVHGHSYHAYFKDCFLLHVNTPTE
ncbi:hypothetical protein LENED_005496 [Lentinula edodes]|uniref:Uncharacterized protein n=1 Tax=Lentinula edodes TaxID=5353 RepID=A0A1Q3E957_LENED|nr:hypothetical protein LENED_005496 [Lentinula edodes]